MDRKRTAHRVLAALAVLAAALALPLSLAASFLLRGTFPAPVVATIACGATLTVAAALVTAAGPRHVLTTVGAWGAVVVGVPSLWSWTTAPLTAIPLAPTAGIVLAIGLGLATAIVTLDDAGSGGRTNG